MFVSLLEDRGDVGRCPITRKTTLTQSLVECESTLNFPSYYNDVQHILQETRSFG